MIPTNEGRGGGDIYMARRSRRDAPWVASSHLGALVNTPDQDNSPSLSADGLTLYFISNRGATKEPGKLWRSRLSSVDAPWDAPQLVEGDINGEMNVDAPRLLPDQRTLMFTRNPNHQWDKVQAFLAVADAAGRFISQRLDIPVKGPVQAPMLSGDGRTLYFSSNMPGGLGGWDLWKISRVPKAHSAPSAATKDAPFVNTLGMKFVPVPITGGPSGGQRVLFSVWETRVQDYEDFAKGTAREWRKPGFEQEPSHPVVNVSWEDATAFCVWLTERERKDGKLDANAVYRLPSDHEWSCAVGIGDREDPAKPPGDKDSQMPNVFAWGSQWPPPPSTANLSGEEARAHLIAGSQSVIDHYRDNFPYTSPVGSFAANALGIFDLDGNAHEWCEDAIGPSDPRHVIRGGAFNISSSTYCLSSKRGRDSAAKRGIQYGFRVVLAPVP